MAKGINGVRGLAVAHFTQLKEQLARVNSGAQFIPSDGNEIFRPDYQQSNDEVAVLNIGPLVINLPERGQNRTNDLFVVFEGRIAFDVAAATDEKKLLTRRFGGHVGYFMRKREGLDHVYGAHYDFDTALPAHPAFHAQLDSYSTRFLPYVRELGQLDLPIQNDCMKGVLPNIRVPIAQLDFFSLIVQLAADHLMSNRSTDDEKRVFDEIVESDKAISGATPNISCLRRGAAAVCHRAGHWYGKAAPAVA